jgi:hypothetical protein
LFILYTIKSAMTNLFIDSESFGGKNVWRAILGSGIYCKVFSVKLLETFLLACENPMADMPVVARIGTIDLRPFEVKKKFTYINQLTLTWTMKEEKIPYDIRDTQHNVESLEWLFSLVNNGANVKRLKL